MYIAYVKCRHLLEKNKKDVETWRKPVKCEENKEKEKENHAHSEKNHRERKILRSYCVVSAQ